MFEGTGIAADRIIAVSRTSRHEYLDLYRLIDIALDPFPYNGHTTTCDALSMAVPVVSLAGSTHVGRAGVSVLHAVGMPTLAVDNTDAFVRRAVDLATNPDRLCLVRDRLRHSVARSTLTDPRRLVTQLEAFFRCAWATWCASQTVDHSHDHPSSNMGSGARSADTLVEQA